MHASLKMLSLEGMIELETLCSKRNKTVPFIVIDDNVQLLYIDLMSNSKKGIISDPHNIGTTQFSYDYQTQHLKEFQEMVPLKRSIRERRIAILIDYVVYL